MLTLLILALGGSGNLFAQVAMVGDKPYATIDEAIANWTNGTTLKLLDNVTLSDVIKLSSTEYHILDLGTYTMTAASGKDAIHYVVNGRSSAGYALDIKADANKPGGIKATGKAIVVHEKPKENAPSKDRPITRFYGGVFNATNIVKQYGWKKTLIWTENVGYSGASAPSFQFYGGEFNGDIRTNRSLNQFHGGVFNGKLYMSVDSSAYGLVLGGKFKYLSNLMGSNLDEKIAQGDYKFTIGSAKATYDRGIYVDAKGYYVITSAPITEVSAQYPAVYKTTYDGDNYFYYSAAQEYGMFYEDVDMAIAKHGEANVTVWVKPAVTIPENVEGDATVVEEIANNTALKDYTPENLPAGAELEIVLVSVGETFVYDVTPMANGAEVEPTEAITFRLPVPASVAEKYARVYHEETLMGVYNIQGEDNAKYVEIASADFSEFAIEPIDPVAKIGNVEYPTLKAAIAVVQDGETITLIADVTLAERVTIPEDKTLTIDLNGKAISMEESIIATAYAINNLGNLTITDGVGGGSINARGIYNGYGDGGANVASATITVLGGTFNAKGTNGGAAIFNYGTANVNGGTFTSIGGYSLNNQAGAKMNITDGVEVTGGIYNNQDAELTVDSGNISNNRSGCHTIYAWNAKVTVNGGSIHNENSGNATIMSAGTSEVTINGGTISIKDGRVPGNGNTWTSCLTDAANTAKIIVNDGTFNGGVRVQGGATMTINGGSFNDVTGSGYNVYTGAIVEVKGGTFTDATAKAFATKYVKAGYVAAENNGIYTVVEAPAYIDGKASYTSLAAAYEAAVNGDVIVLNESVATFPVINKAVTFKGGKENAAVEINYALSQNFTAIDGTVRFENLTFNEPLFTEHGGTKPGLSIEFESCNFNVPSDQGYAILIGTSWSNSVVKGLKVNNCNFKYVGTEFKGGYMLYVQCVNEVTITNNTIDGNKLYRGAIHLGDATEHATVATVSNNTIKNFCRGVMMGNRVAGSSATISGNTFDNINYSDKDSKPTHECAPIFIHSNANAEALKIALTNNAVTNCTNPMIYSEDTDLIKYYVTEFTGNTVDGTAVELANSYNAPNQIFPVATINDAEYFTLQAAINAVKDGETIKFARDFTENVTVSQVANKSFVIDGDSKKFDGTIIVDGNSRNPAAETLTIQNINFETSAKDRYFVDANDASVDNRYSHNVTIKNCSFTAVEGSAAHHNAVAARFRQAFNIKIEGGEFTNMHSVLQAYGVIGVEVSGVKTVNSKSGVSFGTSQNAVLKNVEFAGCVGYGVRADAEVNTTLTIENAKIDAFIPVVVRKATHNYNVVFNGEENTMTATNTDGLWCAIGTSEYEENGKMPTAATGNVSVTLNDAGLNADGIYGNSINFEGSGTEESPYLIKNLNDLKFFRNNVNAGNDYSGKYVKLNADIDLINEEWEPIGYMGKKFIGNFDGGSHTISNLKVVKELDNASANNGVGLFGHVDSPATIKNLTIENATVKGSLYVGAVVGYAYTGNSIENVTVKGNIAIDAWWYAGVIGGNGYMSLVNNCHVIGNNGSYIKGNNGSYIGGIWGFRGEGANNITNCTVTNLAVEGVDRVGGISGMAHYGNTISGCSVNNVTIAATDEEATTVGIIAGACQGTVSEPSTITYSEVVDVTVTIGGINVDASIYGTNINGTTPYTNYVARIGGMQYITLADAVAAANDGETIEFLPLATNKVVAMNASLYGKSVTITGTAKVDWSKGWLFVGRGGEGNATLTFDGANLTSASNSTSTGIHVSGREKETNNKYDGTVVINNSTIELDYLINRGTMTLDDNATLTVKNGFGIAGRPASETESGANATATLTLNNNSKVVVNNHNGMGLGQAANVLEGLGVMNINSGSTFECTQDFLVTANGTMNVNGGVVTIAENKKLDNNGAVVVTGNSNSKLYVKNYNGNAIQLNNGNLTDSYFAGRIDAFGTNNISGTSTIGGILSLGHGTNPTEQVVVNITGNFNGTNVLVSTNNGVDNILNVGKADGERTTVHFGQLGAFADVNIVNSDVTYGYTFIRNDFNVTNSTLAINGGVNTYLSGNAKVVLDNTTWNLSGYANIGSYGGYMYGNADVTLKNGSSMTATSLGIEVSGDKVVKLTLEDNSSLTATKLTNQGTIVLAGEEATLTSNECGNVTTNVANMAVLYKDGKYTLVPPIAKIDETPYASLQAAVNAAEEGKTITLLVNVEQEDGVNITDKKLTIDLNEKTFTVTNGASTNNRNFKIDGASVVTIKNGTMVAAGDYSSGAYGTVRTEGTANVTLTGLKLYNYRGNGLNIKALSGTTVAIDNTEIYSEYGGGIEAAGGTITLAETVKVEQKGMYTAPYNSMAISVNGGGKVTVNGGTYSTECITKEEANNQGTSHGPWVVGVLNSGGTLIINGGTFSNDNFGDNSLATAARGAVLADTGANIEINGGTFNALKAIIDMTNNLGDPTKNPSAVLSGGTFSADPRVSGLYASELIKIAKYYTVVENEGIYSVVKDYVAQVGEERFVTLQEAFNAGGEVVVLKDITLEETATIPAGKVVTLDLAGYTISQEKACTGNYNMIYNKGTLTIKGNGRISFNDTGAGDPNFGWGSYTLRNEGTLVVENGTIEHLGEQNPGNGQPNVHMYCAIFQYSGSSTINGGTISTPTYRSVRLWKGDMTINGGSFEGQLWVQAADNSAELTINGGTFAPRGNDGSSVFVSNSSYDVAFAVTGGTFNHKIGANNVEKAGVKGSITGGLFTEAAKNGTDAKLIDARFKFENMPNDGYYSIIQFAGTQTRELVENWNWFSTYIDSETLLQDLKAELNPNGIQIKGQDGYTQFYSGYGENGAWSPGLTSVIPTKMYMIRTDADVEVELEGDFVEEDREITLNSGWNWIGYPVRERVYVKDAIRNIIPTHGDVIKSQLMSAVYMYGTWFIPASQYGDFYMNPGEGYMYYSNAVQSFDFAYSKETSATTRTSTEPVEYHWIANAAQYPSNMTVIAMLNIDGKAAADNYEVAAFANGECRGSARPVYVDAIDSYVLVMTISGEEVEELTFKCYDVNYGTEYELSNRFNYSSDAILGTADEPYMFFMNTLGVEESTLDMINIYPNPTTRDRAINLQATCDNVEVFNALGVKVAEYQNVDSIDALETAGIYVIRVTINGEVKNCRLVVK